MTSTRDHRTRPETGQGGWSLIELLVVVGIIAILLAILINTAAESRGPVEQTKVTLKALMAIYDEYEASLGSTSPMSLTAVTGATNIEKFCFLVNGLDRTKGMLFALGKDAVVDLNNDGKIDQVKDGWGGVVEFWDGKSARSAGLPGFKGAFFASPGPDGKWGTINPTTNLPTADAAGAEAKDNLFSFNLGD